MHVVVASTFRDSTGYLDRYLAMAGELKDALEARGDTVTFVWGENDSVDGTAERLRAVPWATTVDVSTGAPYYRSHEAHAERWANVAAYCNATLDAVPPCDRLVWVESDLVWTVDTVLSLLYRSPHHPMAAPVFMEDGRFYDTWSTRRRDKPFGPDDPEWTGVARVDSCAGLIVIPGTMTHHRFDPEEAVRGWCRSMGGIFLDTTLRVWQP